MLHLRNLRLVLSPLFALLIVLLALVPATQFAHAAGGIHLSRYRAAANDSFAVTGSGFAASDEVVVTVDFLVSGKSQRIAATAAADGSGNFATSIQVPAGTQQGTYLVIARDFHGNEGTQKLAVLPVAYAQAGATHGVLVYGNHEFYASGTGFGANEQINLTATFPLYNGNSIQVNRTARTDKNGRFYEVLFPVARGAKAGTATLTATGVTSGKKANDNLYVKYLPSITLASYAVRPGAVLVVTGVDYVPFSVVRVAVTIPRTNGSSVTFARNVRADASGSIRASIGMPSDIRPGSYTVSAIDTTGAYKAFAKVTVSIHPVVSADPGSAFPGQQVAVKGSGFGFNAGIKVTATFAISGGGNRTVTVNTTSGGADTFGTAIVLPADAAPGKVTITAQGAHGQATTALNVQPKPAPKPTSTPVPTATSAPTPIPAATLPASVGGSVKKRIGNFYFKYISLWYHPIHAGAYEHLIVHASLHRTLGIWIKVFYANNTHQYFYKNTNSKGDITLVWQIPRSARRGNAVLTMQLWHGKKSVKEFRQFYVVR